MNAFGSSPVLAAAALLPLALASAAEEPAAPRPIASFASFSHDFGEVVRGDTLRHTFIVRNDGNAVLEIQSVHPT